MNRAVSGRKGKIDVWVIIAILIMIAGAVMVYFESKKCNYPMETIIKQALESENITVYKAKLTIFDESGKFPLKEYLYSSDGRWIIISDEEPVNSIPVNFSLKK